MLNKYSNAVLSHANWCGKSILHMVTYWWSCCNYSLTFYFEEDNSPESLTTRLGYDVSPNAEVNYLTFPHGKKCLRMWKNNRATDPAYINRRIKSTNMASIGRKVKLREKTKVSRVEWRTADVLVTVVSAPHVHVLRFLDNLGVSPVQWKIKDIFFKSLCKKSHKCRLSLIIKFVG